MNVSTLKQALQNMQAVSFKLQHGGNLPAHLHVTEVGLVTKHFIDCGGTERTETIANFQLWEGSDYLHRLTPQKFLHILGLSQHILGSDALEIEVEYQQNTVSKFALELDGQDLVLVPKHTACLAQDACGIPAKKKISLSELTAAPTCCDPKTGCC